MLLAVSYPRTRLDPASCCSHTIHSELDDVSYFFHCLVDKRRRADATEQAPTGDECTFCRSVSIIIIHAWYHCTMVSSSSCLSTHLVLRFQLHLWVICNETTPAELSDLPSAMLLSLLAYRSTAEPPAIWSNLSFASHALHAHGNLNCSLIHQAWLVTSLHQPVCNRYRSTMM